MNCTLGVIIRVSLATFCDLSTVDKYSRHPSGGQHCKHSSIVPAWNTTGLNSALKHTKYINLRTPSPRHTTENSPNEAMSKSEEGQRGRRARWALNGMEEMFPAVSPPDRAIVMINEAETPQQITGGGPFPNRGVGDSRSFCRSAAASPR